MPGIVQIVSAISTQVVAALAAASYAPLTDGKILLGRKYQSEETTPPRIIFIPMKSKFGPKSVSNASTIAGNQPYSAEARAQIRQRAIATEFVNFEVRCWGVAPGASDEDADMDFTQALYHAVILSTHLIAAGSFTIDGGDWVDARQGTTQHVHLGREFVFGLTFATPVLDELLLNAPTLVAPNLTNTMTLPSGASGAGCG